MKLKSIPIQRLLPIERSLNDGQLADMAITLFERPIPPISVVVFENDYIINDGHHRATIADFLKKDEIEAFVIDNEFEFNNCRIGYIPNFKDRAREILEIKREVRLSDFKRYYKTYLSKSTADAGIRTIEDYQCAKRIRQYKEFEYKLRTGEILSK